MDIKNILNNSRILSNLIIKIPKAFDLITENNRNKRFLSIYNKRNTPPFSYYFNRLVNIIEPEVSTIICSFIYIDKICENDRFILTEYNINNVFFTSLYLSIKFHEDEIFATEDFALIGYLSLDEIRRFENEFLVLLDFKLYISSNKYEVYLMKLQ